MNLPFFLPRAARPNTDHIILVTSTWNFRFLFLVNKLISLSMRGVHFEIRIVATLCRIRYIIIILNAITRAIWASLEDSAWYVQ